MKRSHRKASVVLLIMLTTLFFSQNIYSEYADVMIDRHKEVMEKVGVKPVVFPHWFHRIRFKCKMCHEYIFIMQKGANNITMASNMKGEFCGKCHDGRIAWDLVYCDRCHSLKLEDKKETQAASNLDGINPQIYLDTSGKLAGTGDPDQFAGEIYKIGLGWHPEALDFPEAPKDKYGLINWVETLKRRLITPRGSLDPKEEEAPPFDMEIVMPAKTGLIEGAYFPHTTHTMWLDCENCHIKLFLPKVGANKLTMSEIVKGNACGACHGKVSFPLNDCTRCHKAREKPAAPQMVISGDKKSDKKDSDKKQKK